MMVNSKFRRIYAGSIWIDGRGFIVRVVAVSEQAVAYQWLTGPTNGSHGDCTTAYFAKTFKNQKPAREAS